MKKKKKDRKQKTQMRFLIKVSLVSLKFTAAGDLDKMMGEGMDLRRGSLVHSHRHVFKITSSAPKHKDA